MFSPNTSSIKKRERQHFNHKEHNRPRWGSIHDLQVTWQCGALSKELFCAILNVRKTDFSTTATAISGFLALHYCKEVGRFPTAATLESGNTKMHVSICFSRLH